MEGIGVGGCTCVICYDRGTSGFEVDTSAEFLDEMKQVLIENPARELIEGKELYWLCNECKTTLEAIQDLRTLVEETRKSIEEKVRWLEERRRRSKRTQLSTAEDFVFEEFQDGLDGLESSQTNCSIDLSNLKVESELKIEPLEFDDSFTDLGLGNIVQIPDSQRNKMLLTEDEMRLVKLWGLDSQPQLLVTLERLKDQDFRQKKGRRFQNSCANSIGCETGDVKQFCGVPRTLRQRTRLSVSDFFENNQIELQDDPDFDVANINTSESETEDQFQNLGDDKVYKRKKKVAIRPEPFFPRIRDGRMWFGSRLIILGNSGFRCCYESCDFTVQKFEDENKSCSVMMDHMKSEHIGSGKFSCRKCVLRFETRKEYFLHHARNHRSNSIPEQDTATPSHRQKIEKSNTVSLQHPLSSIKELGSKDKVYKRKKKVPIRLEPFFPRIKDGQMWFGPRHIILEENGFHCCYESCDFTVQKSEDENKSCSSMMDHMKSEHTGSGMFSCRKCILRFETRKQYFLHHTQYHRNRKYSNAKQTTTNPLQKTEKWSKVHRQYLLSETKNQENKNDVLISNLRNRRSDCDVCGRPIMVARMIKHKWSHMNEEEKADWIRKGRRNPLEKRINHKETSNFSHLCSTCGKGFRRKPDLQLHEEKHKDFSERKKFICDECGKVLITFNGLRIHKRLSHNPEALLGKWKICRICPNRKFLTRTRLDIHNMSYHGMEKKYKCDQCDRRFADGSTLKKHVKTHRELKELFQCRYCSRTYNYNKSLERHIKSSHPENHEPREPIIKPKEKPVELTCKQMYPCTACDKIFDLPSRLRKHAKSHKIGANRS